MMTMYGGLFTMEYLEQLATTDPVVKEVLDGFREYRERKSGKKLGMLMGCEIIITPKVYSNSREGGEKFEKVYEIIKKMLAQNSCIYFYDYDGHHPDWTYNKSLQYDKLRRD